MITARISMSDNAAFSHTFEFMDKSGAPIDQTGSVFRMHVKRKAADSVPVLEMTTENGRIVVLNNTVTLHFPAGLKTTFSEINGQMIDKPYVFDMLRITGGDPLRAMRGTISVEDGATS